MFLHRERERERERDSLSHTHTHTGFTPLRMILQRMSSACSTTPSLTAPIQTNPPPRQMNLPPRKSSRYTRQPSASSEVSRLISKNSSSRVHPHPPSPLQNGQRSDARCLRGGGVGGRREGKGSWSSGRTQRFALVQRAGSVLIIAVSLLLGPNLNSLST